MKPGTRHSTWQVAGPGRLLLFAAGPKIQKGAMTTRLLRQEVGNLRSDAWFYLQLETPERCKDQGQPQSLPTQASNTIQKEHPGKPAERLLALHVASPFT